MGQEKLDNREVGNLDRDDDNGDMEFSVEKLRFRLRKSEGLKWVQFSLGILAVVSGALYVVLKVIEIFQ